MVAVGALPRLRASAALAVKTGGKTGVSLHVIRPADAGRPNFGALGMEDYAPPAAGQTFAELVDAYLASPAFAKLKAHTKRGYRVSLRRLRIVFGAMPAGEVTTALLQHYVEQRAVETPAAAKMDGAVAGVVFSAAVRRGAVAANPLRDCRLPVCLPRERYVEDSELAEFRRHCDKRMDAYIALKLAIGARQSQIVGLRWRDWNGRELALGAAKKGRATRYHGQALEAALDACARAFHGAALAAPPAADKAIVANRDGRPYRQGSRGFMKRWPTIMRRFVAAGGRHFTEHDLRAKVASDSDSLELAQQRLGHTTSQVTQRVYRRAPVRVAASTAGAASGRQLDIFEARPAERKPPAKAARKPAKERAIL